MQQLGGSSTPAQKITVTVESGWKRRSRIEKQYVLQGGGFKGRGICNSDWWNRVQLRELALAFFQNRDFGLGSWQVGNSLSSSDANGVCSQSREGATCGLYYGHGRHKDLRLRSLCGLSQVQFDGFVGVKSKTGASSKDTCDQMDAVAYVAQCEPCLEWLHFKLLNP